MSSSPDSLNGKDNTKSGRAFTESSEAAADSLIQESKNECKQSRAVKMVTGGGELGYNPSYWNGFNMVYRANCYGYILNRVSTNTWDPFCGYNFQPGYRTGNFYTKLTKSAIIKAVKSDMKKAGRTFKASSYSEKPGKNEYKAALVIASNDYHWYRQDSDGGYYIISR